MMSMTITAALFLSGAVIIAFIFYIEISNLIFRIRMRSRLMKFVTAPTQNILQNNNSVHLKAKRDKAINRIAFIPFIIQRYDQIVAIGKSRTFLIAIMSSAFGGFLFGLFVTRNAFFSVLVSLITASLAARLASQILIARHSDRILRALPQMLDGLIRCLRSGFDLSRSLTIVGNEIAPELQREFRILIRNRDLGQPLSSAMFQMAERLKQPEVMFLATLISVQEISGGPLGDALASLSQILKDRERLRQKRLVASAEARMSAAILGGLPVLVASLLFMTNASYRSVLLNTQAGMVFLTFGAMLLATGSYVMARMIRPETT